MICHFQSGRLPARTAPAVTPAPAGDPGAQQVLVALLDRLRGRPVQLTLKGGAEVSGKVIAAAPVTLVAYDGRTVVVTGTIISVAF
jgi:hypothetical protein